MTITQAALFATLRPCTERRTPAAGRLRRSEGRLAFTDVGRGRPLVCLPGLGDTKELYRHVTPLLVARGFRAVSMDLRGHGESDASFSRHAPEDVGTDVLALVEHLGLRDAVLVGESFTAASAVWAAAERPDLVASIVLSGPFVRDLPMSLGQRRMLRLLMRRPWGPLAWRFFYRSLHRLAPADLDTHARTLATNLHEAGRFEALAAMMSASKSRCEARLGEVACPSLVVMGSLDPDFPDPAEEANAIAARLPRARVAMVPGVGHYVPTEAPHLFADTLSTFLAA